jgi:hypothetical protein
MTASSRTIEAPPRLYSRRGRISERMRSISTTLPLQSRPNASPFWIMLLLSLRPLDRALIVDTVGQTGAGFF